MDRGGIERDFKINSKPASHGGYLKAYKSRKLEAEPPFGQVDPDPTFMSYHSMVDSSMVDHSMVCSGVVCRAYSIML